jgi:glycine/D-amino acid oxidase-like deaminating enzyme
MSGPITARTPVRFCDPLPRACDAVVIGGGVIGVFSALYMARAGLKVVLCEKGRIAGEQSSRNWGWIRQLGRDPAELPIMAQALDLWREVDAETGGRVGFRQTGVSYLASTAREMDRLRGWLSIGRDRGVDVRVLSPDQLDTMIQRAQGSRRHEWVGALHVANDARAEPWAAVPAVAALAHSAGVVIREDCAVRGLDIAGGALRGVLSEAGAVRAPHVVLAGGAWSSLLARRHGVVFAQLSVRSTVARTAPLPAFHDGAAADMDLAFRRRLDGGYTLALGEDNTHYIGRDSFRHLRPFLPVLRRTLRDTSLRPAAPAGFPDAWGTARRWALDAASPFERTRVLEPAPDRRAVARMRRLFAQRFGALGAPEIVDSWAGMIDTTPDVVPVVDRVAAVPGLVLASGMCGHGFGIGPGFGRIVADLVCRGATGHDITRFGLARFSDGSRLELGPSI